MPRTLSFADGLGTGLASSALLVLVWLVSKTGAYEAMYQELGNAPMPALTRLMFHPLWTYGAPALVIALGALVLVGRIRFAMLAIAVLAIALAAVTYQGLLGPVFALAGNIR